jgi:hypothetical protein
VTPSSSLREEAARPEEAADTTRSNSAERYRLHLACDTTAKTVKVRRDDLEKVVADAYDYPMVLKQNWQLREFFEDLYRDGVVGKVEALYVLPIARADIDVLGFAKPRIRDAGPLHHGRGE